jgi:hypothetical protein
MSSASEDSGVAAFLRLSRELTGVAALEEDLAPGLLERIKATSEGAALRRLLDTYRGIETAGDDRPRLIRERILGDPELEPLARMAILLWYTGDLETEDEDKAPLAAEHHFAGVLWAIARAHPPGLSGGYFGHWTYPPDNG